MSIADLIAWTLAASPLWMAVLILLIAALRHQPDRSS
tara:strand:+ start:16160 stop:16270 length:111 start_codon:yes stop_codon:yes gene_type:complete